ncbi:hypothetical protein SNE40_013160 [Patella caerulea]|uniref:Reverse transcriptase domain-containing protein n=1 Tax=Patella caerulea TaxID=87958 RepID=A0AAN8PKR5_PATCE
MNTFLFGGDTSKRLDDIEKTNKVVRKAMRGGGANFNYLNNYGGNRYMSMRGYTGARRRPVFRQHPYSRGGRGQYRPNMNYGTGRRFYDGNNNNGNKKKPIDGNTSGNEHEVCMPIMIQKPKSGFNIHELCLKDRNVFKAGRLRFFLSNWEKLTSDPTILDTVAHSHIELYDDEINCTFRKTFVNQKEEIIIDQELSRLLDMGVIEQADHSQGEFISPIFIRPKKDGKFRLILNLKRFNQNVEYHHFKMESVHSAIKLMKPKCYMASIDLCDAYYGVSVAEEHRKFLRFIWSDSVFQFTCFPNGLACCPRKFTKLLKPVFCTLKQAGYVNVPYIDDSYLQADSAQECWDNVVKTIDLLQSVGFIIHPNKSHFIPSQKVIFLGFVLDSVNMTVKLTDEKAIYLKNICIVTLNHYESIKLRDVAKTLGLMIASSPGVELAKLYYHSLENFKIDALKECKGDFDRHVKIPEYVILDINWWIDNITSTF